MVQSESNEYVRQTDFSTSSWNINIASARFFDEHGQHLGNKLDES